MLSVVQDNPHLRKPADKRRILRGKNSTTFAEALKELGIEMRLNALKVTIELRTGTGDWEELDNYMESQIRELMAETMKTEVKNAKGERIVEKLDFGRDGWTQALNAHLSSNRVNPVQDWLKEIQPKNTIDLFDDVLAKCFKVEDTPLNRHIADLMWCGVVARVLEPGHVNRVMPVLVGPQECGKSTFVRSLLPPQFRKPKQMYYLPQFPMYGPQVERVTAMMGMIVAECAELEGATMRNVNSIKAFLGIGADVLRMKYGRVNSTIPRTAFLIGTANPHRALPSDPTGSTRFAVANVRAGTIARTDEFIEALHESAYQKALYLVHSGFEVGYLPKRLSAEQARVNREHEDVHEGIEAAIGKLKKLIGRKKGRTLAELMTQAGMQYGVSHKRVSDDFAKTLSSMGWSKRRERRNGQQLTMYYHPMEEGQDV